MTFTAQAEDEMRRIAVRRARAKLGFQTHLLIYVLVNAGLAVINYTTWSSHPWFLYSVGGWGIGLLAHGLSAYGVGSGRAEAMVEREMQRLRQTARR